MCATFSKGRDAFWRGQGGFCGSQQGNCIWKTSHSCWLLISCPQSTNNARHMMYGFDSLKKKKVINPPSNCKLGYIFQTRFLQQILFSLIYEKLVTSVNVHGWVPSPRGCAGRKSFQQSCCGSGLSLIPINHGGNLQHICQSRFLSQSLPPAREDSRADGGVAAGITKMQGATTLAGLFPLGQAGAASRHLALLLFLPQLASPSRWARSGPWVPGARWS